MAGPRRSHSFVLFRITRGHRENLCPVLPVAIFNLHGNRRTDGLAMANSGEDVRPILFNMHAAATAEALLPPPQLPVDEVHIDVQARRQSGNKGDKALAV